MAPNPVGVLASAIVARLRLAMPEIHADFAASREAARFDGHAPRQAAVFASAVVARLSRRFGAASKQLRSRFASRVTPFRETAETIAAEIAAQLAPTVAREDLPLETIEI